MRRDLSALSALELYAQVFEEENALDKLEGFASCMGPHFAGLTANEGLVTLVKQDWQVPEHLDIPDGQQIRHFQAGKHQMEVIIKETEVTGDMIRACCYKRITEK